jgi:hypothetical protein
VDVVLLRDRVAAQRCHGQVGDARGGGLELGRERYVERAGGLEPAGCSRA